MTTEPKESTGSMAVAGYVRTLRGELSLQKAADRADVSASLLNRLEKGFDVGYTGMILVMIGLGGNFRDLPLLMAPGMTWDTGVQYAQTWMAKRRLPDEDRARAEQYLEELELDGALDVIRRLRPRQTDYSHWLGIGRGLALKPGS